MGSGVGVAETRNNGGRDQSQAGDDGGSPLDTNQVDSLSVGNISLNASHTGGGVGQVDEDTDGSVEIGNVVGNAGNLADGILANRQVEVHGDLSGSHGAQTSEVDAARVNSAPQEFVTVSRNGDIEDNAALDRGDGDNVDCGTSIAGGEDDVEQTGCEAGIILAGVEGVRLEQLLSSEDWSGEVGGQGAEQKQRLSERQPHDGW